MLKKLAITSVLFLFLFSVNTYAGAAIDQTERIPPQMQPGSVIEYGADGSYRVIAGGEINPALLNENGLTQQEQYNADLNLQRGRALSNGNITRVLNPVPSSGLRVIYDGNGFIKAFEGGSYRYSPLPQGTTSPIGTYTWGSHNNTLTVGDNTVSGVGRLTTFSDSTGDNDNTLKKGDVATRGDKDNPKSGTAIYVTAKDTSGNSVTKEMTKGDNGSLPDAILDIWKTGVEYWGYNWTSSLSIDNGSYTYDR